MIRNVKDVINIFANIGPSAFYDNSKLCKQYIKNMAFGATCNTKPIEERPWPTWSFIEVRQQQIMKETNRLVQFFLIKELCY